MILLEGWVHTVHCLAMFDIFQGLAEIVRIQGGYTIVLAGI
jgi:hypothetical protein